MNMILHGIGDAKIQKSWLEDPWLGKDEILEPEDFYFAFSELNLDRGHFVPQGSIQGTPFMRQTQFTSNCAPQMSDLNQGVWRLLENLVRRLFESNE